MKNELIFNLELHEENNWEIKLGGEDIHNSKFHNFIFQENLNFRDGEIDGSLKFCNQLNNDWENER